MTDIVERLRNYAIAWEKAGVSGDQETATRAVLEAADEIEQLRKDVQNLNGDCIRLVGEIQRLEEMPYGTVRNERHHRTADADSQRAPGDPPAVA